MWTLLRLRSSCPALCADLLFLPWVYCSVQIRSVGVTGQQQDVLTADGDVQTHSVNLKTATSRVLRNPTSPSAFSQEDGTSQKIVDPQDRSSLTTREATAPSSPGPHGVGKDEDSKRESVDEEWLNPAKLSIILSEFYSVWNRTLKCVLLHPGGSFWANGTRVLKPSEVPQKVRRPLHLSTVIQLIIKAIYSLCIGI